MNRNTGFDVMPANPIVFYNDGIIFTMLILGKQFDQLAFDAKKNKFP